MGRLIQVEKLCKRFDRIVAVDDLSLQVDEGQVVALLGHNGAGKTTTMRILAGILSPSSGRALIAGLDVVKDAAQVRRIVGLLAELPGLYTRMRAAEYVDFFGELYGLPPTLRRARAAALFQESGLEEAADRRLGEFSKVMRQKVALIRALLHSPRVLFLDEPTSALDPQSAHQVREVILRLRAAGQTVLLSTHNLNEAEALADRIAIVRKGQLVAFGTADELKRRYIGVPLFRVDLAHPLNAPWPNLPGLIRVESTGDRFMRYHTLTPDEANPLLISQLQDASAQVVTIAREPQSLEQVYLSLTENA